MLYNARRLNKGHCAIIKGAIPKVQLLYKTCIKCAFSEGEYADADFESGGRTQTSRTEESLRNLGLITAPETVFLVGFISLTWSK